MSGMTVGFAGLGGMGQGMATNLIEAGHRVTVWNRSAEPVAMYAEHGIGYVSAPVLGRPEAAAAAQLNILAAGDPAAIAKATPLFAAMGRRTWQFGDRASRANTAKISTNFLLASAIEAMAEACTLAEANGVSPTDLVEMFSGTLFPGPVYSGCRSASRTSILPWPPAPLPTCRCPSAACCATRFSTRSRTATTTRTGRRSRPSHAGEPGYRRNRLTKRR